MRASAALLLLLFGCVSDEGRERVAVPLSAAGASARAIALGEAQLMLTRADVAFGPASFCASEAARAELCEVALAEIRDSVAIAGLDPTPRLLGTLSGVSGEVRSALFDYGISWLLTASAPRASSAAPEAHSAVIEGVLTGAGRSVRVRANVDVAPKVRGDSAVNAQRTRHELSAGDALRVQIDPHAWVDRLDPEVLFTMDGDGDGFVQIEPNTPAYDSIVQGMTSRAPPTFVWSADD